MPSDSRRTLAALPLFRPPAVPVPGLRSASPGSRCSRLAYSIRRGFMHRQGDIRLHRPLRQAPSPPRTDRRMQLLTGYGRPFARGFAFPIVLGSRLSWRTYRTRPQMSAPCTFVLNMTCAALLLHFLPFKDLAVTAAFTTLQLSDFDIFLRSSPAVPVNTLRRHRQVA